MWKFQHFSVTQILREINFEDSWSAKSAILTHLEALNFEFLYFLHFLKAEIYQMNKIHSPKMAKTAVFALLEFTKLISRKIWMIQKSWNFHTVCSYVLIGIKISSKLLLQKMPSVLFQIVWFRVTCYYGERLSPYLQW